MNLLVYLFGGMCLLLAIIVVSLDNQRTNLSLEKGKAEGKVSEMEKELTDLCASTLPNANLTVEDINQSISLEGYVPEPLDGWIRFRVHEDNYFVDIRRLPLVIVTRTFCFKGADWDVQRLRDAGRMTAEEMIMIKVDIDEKEDEHQLFRGRIFIATMDRNFRSFRDNLKVYINLIDDGMHRIAELYYQHEQKDESTVAMESFLAQKAETNSVTS